MFAFVFTVIVRMYMWAMTMIKILICKIEYVLVLIFSLLDNLRKCLQMFKTHNEHLIWPQMVVLLRKNM